MPRDTALVVAAITLAFLTFAAVLAWADHYTNSRRPRP
jgi:hypothetical protein